MKCTPSSPPSPFAGLVRKSAGALAGIAFAGGLLAAPAAAGASPRAALRSVPQVAPAASCPSASSVSARAGFTVSAPTSNSTSGSSTTKQFGTVAGTYTVCDYLGGAPTSAQSMHYVILIFVRLTNAPSVSAVKAYMNSQFSKVNKSAPGVRFSYRFGTLAGVPTVWFSGGSTFGTFHMSISGVYGYTGKKVAGAAGVNVSSAKMNALARLAFSAMGI